MSTASVYAQFDDSHIRAVDASVANCGDGTTWNTAYRYLQDALAYASTHSEINQIWVRAGTYYPDQDCANPDGTGLRESTFLLDFNNIQLLGGFEGTETLPEDRDPALYETVLSGDITDPWEDECAPDSGNCFDQNNDTPGCDNLCNGEPCPGCCELVCDQDPFCCVVQWNQNCANLAMGLCSPPTPGDPSKAYHVVTADGVDDSVRIDGFTVTGGLANGSLLIDHLGAGMFIIDGNLAVVRCTFTSNTASVRGGRGDGKKTSQVAQDSGKTGVYKGGRAGIRASSQQGAEEGTWARRHK